jgi:hypothetical protein
MKLDGWELFRQIAVVVSFWLIYRILQATFFVPTGVSYGK